MKLQRTVDRHWIMGRVQNIYLSYVALKRNVQYLYSMTLKGGNLYFRFYFLLLSLSVVVILFL